MNQSLKEKFGQIEVARTALFEKLDALDEQLLGKAPQANAWSVLQIMQHLIQAESGSVAYINKKLTYRDGLKAAGFMGSFRSVLLNTGISLPFKYKAPKIVAVMEDPGSYADVKERWNNCRAELRKLLEGFPDDLLDKETWRHPAAGRMNIFHAISFMQNHFERHCGQIERTLKAVS